MAKAKKTKEKEAKKVSKASKEQIEEMIAKLSKQELTAAKIGLELKKEGIYVKGDKISKIIEKADGSPEQALRRLQNKRCLKKLNPIISGEIK